MQLGDYGRVVKENYLRFRKYFVSGFIVSLGITAAVVGSRGREDERGPTQPVVIESVSRNQDYVNQFFGVRLEQEAVRDLSWLAEPILTGYRSDWTRMGGAIVAQGR